MIKPIFSFTYDGRRFQPSGEGNFWKIDDMLTVSLEAVEYKEFNAVHWLLNFENTGSVNSGILSDIWDCDISLPIPFKPPLHPGYLCSEDSLAVTIMQGMVSGGFYLYDDAASATEYSTKNIYFRNSRKRTLQFSNQGSRSSDGLLPFFELKSEGRGAIAAIGWTGGWKVEIQSTDKTLDFRSGLQNARFYLRPGEKLRTSSILIMEYSKGEDASNKFRRLLREHFSHRACTSATRDGILACELWGGLPSEKMKSRIAEFKAHGIRLEDLWIDAGWYGQCTNCDEPFSGDWWSFTGDWNVNRRIHPQGLEDVRDAAAEAGMRPMLWFEPERVFSNLPVPQKHPEWCLKRKTVQEGATPESLILNYGNEEAYKYALATLSNAIRTLNMGCYRQDFNTDLTDFFENNDEPDRRGITEIRHICGMYRLWDALLAMFPGLVIDNCSSGGRRIDLETIKRSIPFFRSDYQCAFNATPEVVQTHNVGSMRYFPYIGCTTKVCDLYALRSSYASSFGVACYNAVFQNMTEEDFAVLRRAVDDYRRIRRYLSLDFHNHGSAVFDLTSWAIWQYHDPASGCGIVMAFRRMQSPCTSADIMLKGTLAHELTVTSLDDGTSSVITDGQLHIQLPQPRSSAIFEYKR